MNVTSATPESLGQALRNARHWTRGSRARLSQFVRHPISEYRRYIEAFGYDYPVPLVTLVDLVLVGTATVAMIQRYTGGYTGPLPFLAFFLVLLIGPPCVIFNIPPHALLIAGLTASATAMFLVQPIPADFAPGLLIVGAGEIAATSATALSVPTTLLMAAELVLFERFGHVGSGLMWWNIGMLFGWMVGRLLNYQRRHLYQEREAQGIRTQAAADEERRRIAREVHDVIAHSLSVTLLHVTAARHALQTDRDVDEAVDALADAERLGRQAMADIRRTVGLLDQRPSPMAPEPGLDDIPDLIGDFVRAGMPVDVRSEGNGDVGQISPGQGLALYRICQESLSNVAKHAPGAGARVRIEVCDKHIDLTVTNALPPGAADRPGRGMGLSGMRQRVTLLGGRLTAGPDDDGWRVQARIPLTGPALAAPNPHYVCPITGAEEPLLTMLHNITRKPQPDGGWEAQR